MVPLGVFTSDERLLDAVRTLVRKELEKDINHFRTFEEGEEPEMKKLTDQERKEIYSDIQGQVIDKFCSNNLQTQCYDTNYYATQVTLDHLDEDGIR